VIRPLPSAAPFRTSGIPGPRDERQAPPHDLPGWAGLDSLVLAPFHRRMVSGPFTILGVVPFGSQNLDTALAAGECKQNPVQYRIVFVCQNAQ
jgi:hypothetical protein